MIVLKITLGVLLSLAIWRLQKKIVKPPFSLPFSLLEIIPKREKAHVWSMVSIPDKLYWYALWFFGVALCCLEWTFPVSEGDSINALKQDSSLVDIPSKGVALYFVLDRSSSMADRSTLVSEDSSASKPKIDWIKQIVHDLILGNPAMNVPGRKEDLIGLIAFARVAEVICPLTFDKEAVIKQLEKIVPIEEEKKDGTAIGYAIFKTVELIQATRYFAELQTKEKNSGFSIDKQVIILITDGLQSPHPQDKEHLFRFMNLQEAAQEASDAHVRLYIINVEPSFKDKRYSTEREEMQQIAELTGGKLLIAGADQTLYEICQKIDQIERVELNSSQGLMTKGKGDSTAIPFYELWAPYYIGLGLLCLFAAIVGETGIWRVIP